MAESASVADNDHELATIITARIDTRAIDGVVEPIVVGLRGGDLHRTLGSPHHSVAELHSGEGMGFPIDVGIFEPDDLDLGGRGVFVAHMVATASSRGALWNGRTIIAMNAAFRGDQNVAPRGHPNDGRLTVIDGALGLVDRRRALARVVTGSHLPHPDLTVRRVLEQRFVVDRPMTVRLDGQVIGRSRSFTLRCIPDAATIVV